MNTMRVCYNNINLVITLLLLCLSFGCVLEAPEERGEVCPPADMRDVNDELFASFNTLDCYENYVVLQNLPLSAQERCSGCDVKETMLGNVWICKSVSDLCYAELSESLKNDYDNCLRYRNYGIFDETGEKKRNHIAFVHDFKGEPVDMLDNGVDEMTRYCPVKYSDCRFNSQPGPDEPAWFGCVEPCKFPYIYCYDSFGENVCVDPQSDSKHCGARGGCSSDDPNSNDWKGEDCIGGSCEKGICACPKGYAYCDIDGEDDICFDIMNDRFHCGKDCIVCEGTNVCIDGECQSNPCVANHLCQQDNKECRNTQKKCGPTCMNCNEILNIDKSKGKKGAECNEDAGVCEIKDCMEGYHPAYDEHGEHQICKPNTLTECSAPSLQIGESIEEHRVDNCTTILHQTSVICNPKGECEVLSCEEGFVPDGDLCVEDGCSCPDPNETCINGVCECKAGYTNCGNGIGCVDIISDKDNCGGCGNEFKCNFEDDISLNVATSECMHAQCMVQQCKEGFHIYNNTCEENTLEHCGSHENDCTKIEHTVDGSVKCNKLEGVCEFKCALEYHVYSEEQKCELNDISNCLKHDAECNVVNANSMKCDNEHGCFIESCKPNFHVYVYECEPDSIGNCGEHEKACGEHFLCKDSVCQCEPAYSPCKGTNNEEICVDWTSNNTHCGACNNTCTGGRSCVSSNCVCPSGKTFCDGNCTDTLIDNNHCGVSGCGMKCPSNSNCNGGECKCNTGLQMCGGQCVDTKTNDANCGTCGNNCGPDAKCSNGSCVPITTNENCGSIGNSCKGDLQCINKTCKCSGSLQNCSGNSCINVKGSDVNNCGSCGNVCRASNANSVWCSDGTCDFSCPGGTHKEGNSCVTNCDYTYCNGVCTNVLGNDSNNCGSCGHSCYDPNAYNYGCSGGTCWRACNSGYVDNGWSCEYSPQPSCPVGGLNSTCDGCADGYTYCGYSGGYPLCLKLGGVIAAIYCEDYCNHSPGWGGHWTNGKGDYYVTRCSGGQTCSLASYAIGGYVQCY